ncbi:MAG: 30S ribosomal protein S6 [Phycisphaerae bacterium]
MKTVAKKLYEAMFLVDSAQAGSDWDEVLATIKSVLQKAEAEVVSLRKWADKRLAYEIDHKTKGTYILCYFRADGKRIGDIERDVQLSERIMRVLILNAEKQTLEGVEKDASVMPAEKQKAKAEQATEDQQAPQVDAEDNDNLNEEDPT